MATNTLLTVNMITRKALMILEQKLNFIGNMNRQYDSSFAQSGAKIGDSLRIRLPNQYTVRTGAPIQIQDTIEQAITLQVKTQKGVDTSFSTAELTLSMDDFTDRILNPAMSALAMAMESDAFNMANDVANSVGTAGAPPNTLLTYLQAKAILDENYAPMDDQRNVIIPPMFEAVIVDSLKGLFQSSDEISSQYKSGRMGKTAGFDWYTNNLIGKATAGSITAGLTISVPSASGASSLVLATTTAGDTFKKGQTFTVDGVFMVDPNTKAPTANLMNFVITADVTATGVTTTVPISPAPVLTGPYQNVTALPAASDALVFSLAAGTSASYGLAFHKDAFTFASADLLMPQGVDFSAREVWQNLSMRVVRQYDINSDAMPCRIDVLYGYKTLRPQLAVKILG